MSRTQITTIQYIHASMGLVFNHCGCIFKNHMLGVLVGYVLLSVCKLNHKIKLSHEETNQSEEHIMLLICIFCALIRFIYLLRYELVSEVFICLKTHEGNKVNIKACTEGFVMITRLTIGRCRSKYTKEILLAYE